MNISFALPALTPSLQFRPFACWWSLLPEGQSWTPWTCYGFTSWRGVSWPGLLLFSIGLLHEFLLGVDLLPAGNHQTEKWNAKNDVVWAVKTTERETCVFSCFFSLNNVNVGMSPTCPSSSEPKKVCGKPIPSLRVAICCWSSAAVLSAVCTFCACKAELFIALAILICIYHLRMVIRLWHSVIMSCILESSPFQLQVVLDLIILWVSFTKLPVSGLGTGADLRVQISDLLGQSPWPSFPAQLPGHGCSLDPPK